MKRKIALLTLAAVMGMSVVACGGSDKPADEGTDKAADSKTEAPADDTAEPAADGEVENKDKPLVWFNRQPSEASQESLIQQRCPSTKIILF